jgi:hypothetical protein
LFCSSSHYLLVVLFILSLSSSFSVPSLSTL